ncbi:MAG: LamG domain-containing protein [Sedimentisphaerales bacterium]|nr:LamG domain-containing protein [Sedimentisphaerales bacterium]
MCKRFICLISLITVLAGVTEADLVGLWRFDETSGTIAHDSSGNGHDGTFNGDLTWTAGRIGGALDFEFDNTNECVVIPPFEVIGGGLTLAAWVKPESFSQADARIIDKGVDVASANDAWWMLSPVSSGGQIRLRFRLKTDEGSTTLTQIATSGGLVVNEWAHTAAIWDGTSMILYQDGVEVGRVAKGGTAVATNPDASIYIGNQLAATQRRPFDGLLDDVRVYNVALAQEQLQVLVEGSEGYPFAFNPNPTDGAVYENTWITLNWSAGDFAVSHDVYLGVHSSDVENATRDSDLFRGNQVTTFYIAGFPGFAYPDGLIPGTTYYWRIDEVNDADPNSPWKGPVWSFSIPPKTAYNPNPADGAEFVGPENVALSWTTGYGAKLHTVFLGDDYDEVSNATVGVPVGMTSYKPGSLELEKVYYWRVDEFDGIDTYKGDVWGFTTPGAAGHPQPANSAVDIEHTKRLTWTPADNATSHQVYFGMDKEVVMNATTDSPEYKGNKALGSESYDPGKLAWHASYYWRVDAVYNTGTVKGLVWSFTTADFLVVDDFESYNDIDPPDPESNRIFDTWIDGFGTTDNGALIGNDLPAYAEQTIVHGGSQSMIYRYDNTGNKTSEATITLVQPRDWTEGGVTKLSLWVRGDSANAAESVFIVLNGTAGIQLGDSTITQKTGWTEGTIDLAEFTGIDLTNVQTITIGIGASGDSFTNGTGTMYFDDIRLYP